MGYSYLELYVEYMARDVELRTVNRYTYIQDVKDEEWLKAANGLNFFINELDDPSIRTGYIKIPETHQIGRAHV